MRKDLYQELYERETKHWWHLAKRNLVREVLNRFRRAKSAKILDLGCGTGANLEMLGRFGTAWGVDSSPEALRFCRKRGLENVRLGSAQNTPFRGEIFEVVTALDLLEHTDDAAVLREANRLLKPNGFLILTVPAFSWMWGRWDEILGHRRRYTAGELARIVNGSGFIIKRVTYTNSFLLLPVFLVRKIKTLLFKKDDYPSDFQIANPFLNSVLQRLSNFEKWVTFRLNISIPFGLDILLVAQKQE